MKHDLDIHRVQQLYKDCCDLAKYIAKARREIALLRPDDLKSDKLPRAGQELEAIVQATEDATNTIMQTAEELMAATPDDLDAFKAKVDDACMTIFEACSFQDITGQRVGKVVKTIEYVEERLATLQSAWGPDLGDALPDPKPQEDGEAALLHGPALEGEGVSQQDIDAMFDEDPPPKKGKARPAGAKTSDQAEIDALFD